MKPHVYAIATMDTKGEDLQYVAQLLQHTGVPIRTIDVGTSAPPTENADVSREELLSLVEAAPSPEDLASRDRGEAVAIMSEALTRYLVREQAAGHVAGVIGLGGSGGTALITAAMRALPLGLPKLMVSTVASGNTAPYVDCNDITMVYSVVDVAGLNSIARQILANAAHAMAGMVSHEAPPAESRPLVGMTMFGVTTPCVTHVKERLEARGFECLIFHATGTGGRALEKLVESGYLEGVLDITTTEVADEIVGGIFPAGPARFDAIVEAGIPYVLSVGALDMVNFGARDTVPDEFHDRTFHIHNPQVTLMRTTPEENMEFAKWIAGKLRRAKAPIMVVIPEEGVSALDAADQPFHDPEADEVLFETLDRELSATPNVRLQRVRAHINDYEFADQVADCFLELNDAAQEKEQTR